MMPTVYLSPQFAQASTGGVAEVVRQLTRYLPKAGWRVTTSLRGKPDIVHGHALPEKNALPHLDVYTNHGVIPGFDSTRSAGQANALIAESLLRASAVTAVSRFSADKFAWMGANPTVVHNGVDVRELDQVKIGDFRLRHGIKQDAKVALWAKTNMNHPCDDGFALASQLAWACRSVVFVFTIWRKGVPKPPNVLLTGPMSRPDFLQALAASDVFLSTCVENFPIAVLEAMALRKPVLALKEGGNLEVGCEGAFFEAGDVVGMAEGLRACFDGYEQMGEANRKVVETSYTWDGIAAQYIGVYEEVLAGRTKDATVASIVITNHNLRRYLRASVASALKQGFARPYEVILVDDCSTDGSLDEIADLLPNVRLIRHETNKGVVVSRNEGVEAARGEYCCCLDADDTLGPRYLDELVPLLEKDRLAGIAAPTWEVLDEATGKRSPPYNLKNGIDLEALKAGNKLPCASLFRKRAWRGLGGQKEIHPSWEDYEMWLAVMEAGWKVATHVAQPVFHYTLKSSSGRNVESHGQEGRLRATVNAYHPRLYRPTVSVVIPVYSHPEMLQEAVGSVLAQTFQDFEIIVVDDGIPEVRYGVAGMATSNWPNEPRIEVIRHERNLGLPAARNTGFRAARGRFVLPLDDDDKLRQDCIEVMLRAHDGLPSPTIIYSDYFAWFGGEQSEPYKLADYDFDRLLERDFMSSCALIPRSAWERVGGYDEAFTYGFEDYDFYVRCGLEGICGLRVPEPLFYYRQHKGGSMRTNILKHHNWEAVARMVEKYKDAYQGRKPVGCCGKGNQNRIVAVRDAGSGIEKVPVADNGKVVLKFLGDKESPVTILGSRVSRKRPYIVVPETAVDAFLDTRLFVKEKA